MGNRFLGEATVVADGRTFTLRCDFNAMCEFEDQTGENALSVFQEFETGKVSSTHMRAMMWAFMQHHHPDATLKDAGELLSANVDSLLEVIEASSPQADEAAELGNVRKPAKKKRAA